MLAPLCNIKAVTAKKSKAAAIQWAPCNIDLGVTQDLIKLPIHCAELNVPLDYTNPESNESLPLQLIKINATKAPFKGSVIFNPGGPGQSGIQDLAESGILYNR